MRQTFGDGGSIIQDSNTTGAMASSHNDIHHKGRDWLPVQGLARPARCKYAMFGSPDKKLGQARVVQKAPSSQARPMRVPLAFPRAWLTWCKVRGHGERSASTCGKARVTAPIHAIHPSHYHHGGGKDCRVSLSFPPFIAPISVVEAALMCHSHPRDIISSQRKVENLSSPLPFYSLLLQVCA
jgi:hypothetical protein